MKNKYKEVKIEAHHIVAILQSGEQEIFDNIETLKDAKGNLSYTRKNDLLDELTQKDFTSKQAIYVLNLAEEELNKNKPVKKEKKTKQEKFDINKYDFSEQEIKQMLSQEKKPKMRLGQGIHNNVFYYGTTLKQNDVPVSAVVTSDKKIYVGNAIKEKFGLDYRTEFDEDSLDLVWENKEITEYLNEQKQPNLKEIYERIIEINKKYIDHVDSQTHSYIACDIISSYFFSLFEEKGRTFFNAERGSGKTKQSKIYKYLAFNSNWITRATSSSIFRDVEGTCGTLIIDNMDKLNKDMKQEMEHHIETGWQKDSKYKLTEEIAGKKRTIAYSNYGHCVVNNILGLHEDTLDKTFQIKMVKTTNNKKSKLKITKKSEKWGKIRTDLRVWILNNHKKIENIYETDLMDEGGREFDVVEASLLAAKLISDNVFDSLLEYVKREIENNKNDYEDDLGFQVFGLIYNSFEANEPTKWIKPLELSGGLTKQWYPDLIETNQEFRDRRRGTSKKISALIKGIAYFKTSRRVDGKIQIFMKKQDVVKYIKTKDYPDVLKEKQTDLTEHDPNESKHLPKSTSTINPTNTYSSLPNNINNNKEEKKEDKEATSNV